MTEEIVQLCSSDYEEMLDFVNLVFSLNQHPMDFSKLFPLIYAPGEDCMACNYAIRRNGRIVSMANMPAKVWNVGGKQLRIAGIGGVATHPRWRGQGFMSQIMRHCVERMRVEGYHASWLGGLRARYRNFGYEKCGLMYSFAMRKENLNRWADESAPVKLQPLTAQDQALLACAKELHDRQRIYCEYPGADFYQRLITWQDEPYAALDENGEMVGYLVAIPKTHVVTELIAKDEQTGVSMAKAWFDYQGIGNASVNLLPHQKSLIRAFGQVFENVSVLNSGNWQIFDWAAVVESLLRVQGLEGMIEGRVVLEIVNAVRLLVRYEGGQVQCTATEQQPDLRLSPEEAMRLFFGPMPPSCVTLLPKAALALENWCPLPLGWCRPDTV